MTQLILIEATRDTTFDVSFGFEAKPSKVCQFHGSIDCLLYQRYGGDHLGVPDLNEEMKHGEKGDTAGIGFPLLPIFFPIVHDRAGGGQQMETFPLQQAVSAGLWCLEHMSEIDPTIEYARCMHTDGHRWKLYEIHRTHVKKTKFFAPDPMSRINNEKIVKHTSEPRFFDDYDHMLSVIGLIRFAMGISENIVMGNDSYEVEELPAHLDPTRTI